MFYSERHILLARVASAQFGRQIRRHGYCCLFDWQVAGRWTAASERKQYCSATGTSMCTSSLPHGCRVTDDRSLLDRFWRREPGVPPHGRLFPSHDRKAGCGGAHWLLTPRRAGMHGISGLVGCRAAVAIVVHIAPAVAYNSGGA